MPRRHIHSTLDEDSFKKVKKKTIDMGVDLKDFISNAVVEKLEREEEKNLQEEQDS